MNTDKNPQRRNSCSCFLLIRVHLWPISLRSGGWTARLVKQDPRGVGIHSPFIHLTIDRRASVWNPYLTGLRPSPPVPYPLKPAKVGLGTLLVPFAPGRSLSSRRNKPEEWKSEADAVPCRSPNYRFPRHCPVGASGVTACEPVGQGARECRPMHQLRFHACLQAAADASPRSRATAASEWTKV